MPIPPSSHSALFCGTGSLTPETKQYGSTILSSLSFFSHLLLSGIHSALTSRHSASVVRISPVTGLVQEPLMLDLVASHSFCSVVLEKAELSKDGSNAVTSSHFCCSLFPVIGLLQ